MATLADPVRVVLLALPETTPGALYGVRDVLASAGTTWSQVTGEPESAARLLETVVASRDGGAFVSPIGGRVAADAPLAETSAPDVVVVTDLAVDMRADPGGRWPEETRWLREAYAAGATVCAACTGAVFLAQAGLLDGLEATTHWAATPIFRDHYPQVRLAPARILCPAGPEHRIVTAGGASSWCELALYLVARFCGEEEARRMARVFLIGDRSDGQAPFAAMALPRQHEDAAVAAAQLWIADNYAAPNPVGAMASRAGLGERTFARRFRRATGYGPVEYVQALRIEEAKQMLETTGEPVDAVALAVGYADPANFRRLFKREVGVSPARYRQRFGRARARAA